MIKLIDTSSQGFDELCLEFEEESGTHLDLEHFKGSFQTFIEQGIGVIFGAIEDEKLIGFIGLLIIPNLFSSEIEASEMFWFVTKEKRGTKAGISLLKRAEAECWDRGVGTFNIAGFSDEKIEKLSRFFVSQNYREKERFFTKKIEGI